VAGRLVGKVVGTEGHATTITRQTGIRSQYEMLTTSGDALSHH